MTEGVITATPDARSGEDWTSTYPQVIPGAHDRQFEAARVAIQTHFDAVTAGYGKLFIIAPRRDLYGLYLAHFGDPVPEGQKANPERQYHTCFADAHFIRRWGRLAAITPAGEIVSAVWPTSGVPDRYRAAFAAMKESVERGTIIGPFADEATTWGTPQSNGFTHFAIDPPMDCVHVVSIETATQRMAQWRQDFIGLEKAIRTTKPEQLAAALNLLRNGNLQQANAVLPQAEWFYKVMQAVGSTAGGRRNLLWKFVAEAPRGWCFPLNGMVGTVLEDIKKGLRPDAIKAKFNAKTAPTQFKTAQVAPTEGAIKVAEKRIAQLGLADALDRRFATFADVEGHLLWRPAPPAAAAPAQGGVFAHLTPKNKAPATVDPRALAAPRQMVTWEKFARTVLPTARKIEVLMGSQPMNFAGLTTAVNADAKPLLQWDREGRRNPVSWYVFPHGSPCTTWGFLPGRLIECVGVILQPSMWGYPEAYEHHGRSAIFLLKGAHDESRFGNGLFSSQVRGELHEIRSVITEYSENAEMFGRDGEHTAGLRVADGSSLPNTIRVTSDVGVADYYVERWD